MSVFHPDVYRTDRKAPSYWEASASVRPAPALQGVHRTEVAIIGGGFVGLSAALHLARDHGIHATVLEAGPIGWGASGRNGGFVGYPWAKLSPDQLAKRFGEAETRRFFSAMQEGPEIVRELIAGEGIDADVCGDTIYEVAHTPKIAPELKEAAEVWHRRLGVPSFYLDRHAFAEIGHGGTEQFGAFGIRDLFGIHPLKFVAGLREGAERRGATLFSGSAVTAWESRGGEHVLKTAGGEVRAKRVLLATNGYTPDDLSPRFANRTLPALSNIIVTRPLTQDELDAEGWKTDCPCSNARNLLFYYRMLPGNRFLFGGRGGTAGSPLEDMRMKAYLTRRLGEVFPAWKGVEIDHFWNGLVCLTGRLTPAMGRIPDDPTIHFAFGWHGNGVSAAPWAGARMAAMIAGAATEEDLPAAVRGLPPNLLHPWVRRFGLKAAYLWYGLKEPQ